MKDRLEECQCVLKCVLSQANADAENAVEDRTIPDNLEACERKLIEIIKKRTLDEKYENANYVYPVYFAAWRGAYEGAFEYLVENGLAEWRHDGDWNQMICLLEDK